MRKPKSGLTHFCYTILNITLFKNLRFLWAKK